MEKFLALKQDGIVREHRRDFEMLAAPLSMVPNAVLEGNFTNGLKTEIQAEIRMHKPKGLGQFHDLAQRVEDRNEFIKHAQLGAGPNRLKLNFSSPNPSGNPRSISPNLVMRLQAFWQLDPQHTLGHNFF